MVESLSDSAIYPSYYNIAHYLHKDLFGRERDLGDIKSEQMTGDVWDYVFTRRNDVKSNISQETLQSMLKKSQYWYPLDLRVSGQILFESI